MKRSTLGWLAAVLAFVFVLAYTTMKSAPAPGATELARGGPGAAEACKSAVHAKLSGARFPFPSKVVDLGSGRYRAHGMVDERLSDEVVRRNYECLLTYAEPAGFRADSVRIWQSH